jgi:hypothetical protein
VALSPQAHYADSATATCRRNIVPTFVDRGVSRGQRSGSPTVVVQCQKRNSLRHDYSLVLIILLPKDRVETIMSVAISLSDEVTGCTVTL